MARVTSTENTVKSFTEAGKEALKVYRARREEALARLRNALEASLKDALVLNEDLKADLKLVLGNPKKEKSNSKQNEENLFTLLSAQRRINLSEAAKTLGVTEAGVISLNKALRKASRGDNRAFAYFEFSTNELVLEHVGPTVPKGWKEIR